MAGELHEKCAVTAVSLVDSEQNAAEIAFETLFAQQHRGTEASGIASLRKDGSIAARREDGMVRDVYNEKHIRRLAGQVAIGHNRYATSGPCSSPQPVIDEPIGFALGHNGNLPQTKHLSTALRMDNFRLSDVTDSEMMGMAVAQQIRNGRTMPDAIERTYPLFRGAFSCVTLHDGVIAAFRDSRGIRPLAIGEIDGGLVVTSETSGLDIVGAKYLREVEPGEMIVIGGDNIESRKLAEPKPKLDIFEFVYFARPDSRLYGQSVNEVRYRSGVELALEHGDHFTDTKNTLVVPVPETSVPAAEGFAEELGLPHRKLIVKNQYSGRTFMQPSQGSRQKQLRRKHNFIDEAVAGKDLVLVDDSIVRLNTMPRLVALAHELGAKSVSVLLASPPVRFPDFYGIDTPQQSELAAANLTVEQMREEIGCEYLGFLSLSRLIRSTSKTADMFNLSCFTGEYPIGIGSRKKEIHQPISMEYID